MKQGILTHFLLSFVLALSGAIATAHPSTSSSAVIINKCLSSPYQTKSSSTHYPAGYAMSASDAHSVFLYADSYGDDLSMRKGAFVTQVSSKTLKPIWYNRLIDSRAFDAWEYPGNLNVSGNFLYVNHALHLYQIDPKTGKIVKMLELPTGAAAAQDTSYYGFIAASSNTIILKSVSRPAGCAIPGPRALVDCRASTISPSILLAVDTNSITITDQITLPAVPTSKPTLAYFNGGEYIYIPQGKTIVRYQLNGQHFALDTTWNPGNILLPGQTMPAACSILNDWVVVQTNGAPSASPSSLIIINQNNAAQQNSLQPFAHDILPLLSAKKFATTAAGQPAVSWVPTSATVDSASNTI